MRRYLGHREDREVAIAVRARLNRLRAYLLEQTSLDRDAVDREIADAAHRWGLAQLDRHFPGPEEEPEPDEWDGDLADGTPLPGVP